MTNYILQQNMVAAEPNQNLSMTGQLNTNTHTCDTSGTVFWIQVELFPDGKKNTSNIQVWYTSNKKVWAHTLCYGKNGGVATDLFFLQIF